MASQHPFYETELAPVEDPTESGLLRLLDGSDPVVLLWKAKTFIYGYFNQPLHTYGRMDRLYPSGGRPTLALERPSLPLPVQRSQ